MKFEILINKTNKEIQNGIILNVRDLIRDKSYKYGDGLSSRRMLLEKLCLIVSNVKEVVQKIGLYNILRLRTPDLEPLYLYCYST